MHRSTPPLPAPDASLPLDLALVAQRILKLAEISVLEHLESLDRSQAMALSDMLEDENDTASSN